MGTSQGLIGKMGKKAVALGLLGGASHLLAGCAPMTAAEQRRAEERMLTLGLSALLDAKNYTDGANTLRTATQYHAADSAKSDINVTVNNNSGWQHQASRPRNFSIHNLAIYNRWKDDNRDGLVGRGELEGLRESYIDEGEPVTFALEVTAGEGHTISFSLVEERLQHLARYEKSPTERGRRWYQVTFGEGELKQGPYGVFWSVDNVEVPKKIVIVKPKEGIR
jgi:hypothetical protein